MNKKRVLHIITGLNTGGAEMMLYKIMKYRSHQIEYKIVSLTNLGPIASKIKETGIEVTSLNMGKSPLKLFNFLKLFKIIHQYKPNLIQTWLYHSDLIGGVIGFMTRTPVFWNIRQEKVNLDLNKWTTVLTFKLCAFFSFIPKKIIHCSQKAQVFHKNAGFNSSKFITIPNGFELDEYYPPTTQELEKNFQAQKIIHVGRYAPLKNHKGFLEIANILKKEFPDMKFHMYGDNVDSSNRELINLINEMDLHERVELHGRCNDLAKVYRSSTLLISTSFSEGFSNTIGEAMACGLPVLATDAGDNDYIISNKYFIFDLNDKKSIISKAKTILEENIIQYIQTSHSLQQRIQNNFNIKLVTEKYENLYLS